MSLMRAQGGLIGRGAAAVLYNPVAAVFDGTNDALYRIGASDADPLTGATDGKLFSASFTIKRLALSGPGGFPRIVGGQIGATATRWSLGFEPSDHATPARQDCLFVEIRSTAGTTIAYLNSTIPFVVGTTYRVGVSVDRNTRTYRLRVDNVDRLSIITDVVDTAPVIDFTTQIYTIGARASALTPTFDSRLNAELTDLSIYFDRAIDWSSSTEWERFFEAGTHALQWKANDGSKPYGSRPTIYQSGAIGQWHTNRGSGGGFTLSGALTAAASPPAGAAIPQFGVSSVGTTVNTANSVIHVQGSDNWPIAVDSIGNQLTSWGDGSEPRDTNNIDPGTTRASLGFARINSPTYAAFLADHDTSAFFAVASSRNTGRGAGVSDINFAAGAMLNPAGQTAGGGKCYGIQTLPSQLVYALVGSQRSTDGVSNTPEDQIKNVTLIKSTDNGATWSHVSAVSWNTALLGYAWAWPCALNFGSANGAAQDEYLYWYAGGARNYNGETSAFFFQSADVMLVRVPVNGIETLANWQVFTGMSGSTPQWSSTFTNWAPVPGLSQAGANQLPNVCYIPEFDEIVFFRNTNGNNDLLVTVQTNLQFLRSTSRRPWGPFTTVQTITDFRPYDPDVSGPSTSARGLFFFSVSPKWLAPSTGTTTKTVAGVLTYTGRQKTTSGAFWDAWNSVGLTFTLTAV